MTTSDKILVWQTIAIALGALVTAPLTIWAMFRQTRLAASIADNGKRRECVEKLLSLHSPGCPQSGEAFYQVLNSVPALFAPYPDVLEQYRLFRETAVHRDREQWNDIYPRLLVLMAAASSLPLTEADINAAFGSQWGPSQR